jgi:hypothetical protein
MTLVELENVMDWLRANIKNYQFAENDYLLDGPYMDRLLCDLEKWATAKEKKQMNEDIILKMALGEITREEAKEQCVKAPVNLGVLSGVLLLAAISAIISICWVPLYTVQLLIAALIFVVLSYFVMLWFGPIYEPWRFNWYPKLRKNKKG